MKGSDRFDGQLTETGLYRISRRRYEVGKKDRQQGRIYRQHSQKGSAHVVWRRRFAPRICLYGNHFCPSSSCDLAKTHVGYFYLRRRSGNARYWHSSSVLLRTKSSTGCDKYRYRRSLYTCQYNPPACRRKSRTPLGRTGAGQSVNSPPGRSPFATNATGRDGTCLDRVARHRRAALNV
jgi:hypothetical protein